MRRRSISAPDLIDLEQLRQLQNVFEASNLFLNDNNNNLNNNISNTMNSPIINNNNISSPNPPQNGTMDNHNFINSKNSNDLNSNNNNNTMGNGVNSGNFNRHSFPGLPSKNYNDVSSPSQSRTRIDSIQEVDIGNIIKNSLNDFASNSPSSAANSTDSQNTFKDNTLTSTFSEDNQNQSNYNNITTNSNTSSGMVTDIKKENNTQENRPEEILDLLSIFGFDDDQLNSGRLTDSVSDHVQLVGEDFGKNSTSRSSSVGEVSSPFYDDHGRSVSLSYNSYKLDSHIMNNKSSTNNNTNTTITTTNTTTTATNNKNNNNNTNTNDINQSDGKNSNDNKNDNKQGNASSDHSTSTSPMPDRVTPLANRVADQHDPMANPSSQPLPELNSNQEMVFEKPPVAAKTMSSTEADVLHSSFDPPVRRRIRSRSEVPAYQNRVRSNSKHNSA
eukprot:Awhi_evm1s13246